MIDTGRLHTSGVPIGFKNKIIAKCTYGDLNKENRSHKALILGDSNYSLKDIDGYSLLISNENIIQNRYSKLPIIHSVKHTEHITEGDVISANGHNGSIQRLYRVNSKHNSLFVTERCNSHCIMCSQPPTKTDDSDRVWELLELINLMDVSTEHIGITGGEPTLLKDNLFKIISSLKNRLPNTSVTMLTNGRMFYYRSFAENFSNIGHPNFLLAIPLYSSIPEEHDYIVSAKNAFVETMKGLYNLGSLNQPIEIRFVIHAKSYQYLPKLAEYIYYNLPFVSHVALMGLEIMGYARKNLDILWVDPVDYQQELEEAVEYLSIRNIDVSIYNHQLCVLRENLWPFARKSISDWKNIYLDECSDCSVLERCGGFFKSSKVVHSKFIKSI